MLSARYGPELSPFGTAGGMRHIRELPPYEQLPVGRAQMPPDASRGIGEGRPARQPYSFIEPEETPPAPPRSAMVSRLASRNHAKSLNH
jgi:hypothetical protein